MCLYRIAWSYLKNVKLKLLPSSITRCNQLRTTNLILGQFHCKLFCVFESHWNTPRYLPFAHPTNINNTNQHNNTKQSIRGESVITTHHHHHNNKQTNKQTGLKITHTFLGERKTATTTTRRTFCVHTKLYPTHTNL